MPIDRRVFALVLAFMVLNLLTIKAFPIVWGDEVMFVEPAWNLVRTGFMHSLAWYYQDATQWWAGNAPLHSLLLAIWLKLVGLGIAQVRAFGLIEYAAAVCVLLLAAASLQERPSAQRQALFVLVAFLAYSLTLNYRSGRYDPTGILLLSLVCLGLARGSGGWLRAGVPGLLCAFLLPVSGVHVAVFFMVLLAVLAVVGDKEWRPGLLGVGLAAVTGALTWIAVYAWLGLLEPFVRTAHFLRSIQAGAYTKDPSLYLLLLATLVFVLERAHHRSTGDTDGRRLMWGTVLLVSSVPLVFVGLGRFPTYYSWMLLLPMALLLTQHPAAFGAGRGWTGRGLALARWGLLAGALLVGLPLQLASAYALKDLRDYGRVLELAQAIPQRPSVPLLVSPAAWYAVLPRSDHIYLESFDVDHRLLSAQQLQQIEYALLTPEDHAHWMPHLGGTWEKLDEIPGANAGETGGLFRRGFGDKLAEYYELGLYRRLDVARSVSAAP